MSVDTKPETLAAELRDARQIPTFEEVRERIAAFIHGENEDAEHSIGDLSENSEPLAPAEAFRRWNTSERRMVDPKVLDLCLQQWAREVRVGRNGITIVVRGMKLEYRLDDEAGLHPVRVLLTEGVSKRQVLDGLRAVVELVANDWEELVGSDVPDGESIPAADDWFHGPRNKKGDASLMPTVPELAGNRNEKGAEAKPADQQHSR